MLNKSFLIVLVAVLALLVGVGSGTSTIVRAHGGDTALHVCVKHDDLGKIRVVGPDDTCKGQESLVHLLRSIRHHVRDGTVEFGIEGNVHAPRGVFVAGSTTIYGNGVITLTKGTNMNIDNGTLYIENSKNRVGIGTTKPSSALHVVDEFTSTNSVENVLTIERRTTGTPANGIGGAIEFRTERRPGSFQTRTGRIMSLIQANANTLNDRHSLAFEVRNNDTLVEGMRIRYDGKIGIGTPNPSEQLQITGNFRLPPSTATVGVIKSGGNRFIHNIGTNNFFAGVNAGNLTATGVGSGGNTGVGAGALRDNTTGSHNTATGWFALRDNTTGFENTATGRIALGANTAGSRNTATGSDALFNNTTGNSNTATGAAALLKNTTGSGNTAAGGGALRFNTTGSDNTATGRDALRFNTTGSDNTAAGVDALFSNTMGSSNTAAGVDALRENTTGNENMAAGRAALRENTTGSGNTAVGGSSLQFNTTGNENMAAGQSALRGNTTGSGNTAAGAFALLSNTSGIENTAAGHNALFSNTMGGLNTAAGHDALHDNTTGSFNTAAGVNALSFNTIGSSNTAAGHVALFNNTGSENTAAGQGALFHNTTGSNNTALGEDADVSSGDLNNATAIGAGAIVDASNKIRLGDSNVTVIEGQVAYTFTSDANLKENFRAVDGEETLEKIRQFNLGSWNFKEHDPLRFRHYGPMAQEFFAAFGDDGFGTVGTETTINSGDLAGILMIAIQTLEKRTAELDSQRAQIAELRQRNIDLEARLTAIEQELGLAEE